ncbi:MAG: hypothetical protein JST00_28315 [Deltaproteobacteria bacterium]|nr:hypothetical protein [Deltaproteobacteria bacterium]
MFVVFVAHLARPGFVEAEAIAPLLGMTPYEARLSLATPPPCILLTTTDRARATDVLAVLRSRSHGAHLFDFESFTPSHRMTRIDDFWLDAEGVHRASTNELLPFGDVFAIIRAIHDTTGGESVTVPRPSIGDGVVPNGERARSTGKVEEREHVAYFFRRSGERPWLLRERHAVYTGLGDDRLPVAFGNFSRLLTRVREASANAIFDDRLVRRRVAEKMGPEGVRTSRDGVDLLAHLLAMTIASQGGSPYR